MVQRWVIAFDADDTLWHNERFFELSQSRFAEMLADFAQPDHLHDRLLVAERRNLALYGFGVKGFTLSMIEAAIEVTDAQLPARIVADILAIGREMLVHPIELLPSVSEAIDASRRYGEVIVITKGDLLDQERKVAQSGLGEHFDAVEIVSEKTPEVYQKIFARFDRPRAMMIGNSLKSDVIPAIEAGAWGIHVPHDLTWALERAEPPVGHPRFFEINDLGALPDLLRRLN